ncbi:16S rRNA (uracil(1498)-N(3))-methyltransferase [Tropicimonas sp. S265A]|uniref:16S rRNA (uracil(1498)-N(3))-methyltransferase n=1 Tax=Tropicimonas sp. S265A TaxID=3415134 RepID=UPI003C7E034D
MSAGQIRLYVDDALGEGQTVPLTREHAHYLANVMRRSAGDTITVFNGRDGAWTARIKLVSKRGGVLVVTEQTAPQQDPPDLWLVFAPIKKARTDFIVEKAAEMGAARILPVQTAFTNAERVRQDRLQAHAVEAAEQCGGTFVPEVAALQKLDALLANWPADRHLMFCDEALAGDAAAQAPLDPTTRGAPWAVLIGPEGGFSAAERTRLRAMDRAVPVQLGPRILRADTAAVAALTLWQSSLGDW